jgi:hypothetical protein
MSTGQTAMQDEAEAAQSVDAGTVDLDEELDVTNEARAHRSKPGISLTVE